MPGISREALSPRQGQRRSSGPRPSTDRPQSVAYCSQGPWVDHSQGSRQPGARRLVPTYSRHKQQTPLHPRPAHSSTPAQILSSSHGPPCPRSGQAETRGFATTHLPTHLPASARANEPGVSRPKPPHALPDRQLDSSAYLQGYCGQGRGRARAAPAASRGPSAVRAPARLKSCRARLRGLVPVRTSRRPRGKESTFPHKTLCPGDASGWAHS